MRTHRANSGLPMCLAPGKFIPVPASRDRSALVRVWIGFGSISGRPKSLTKFGFKKVVPQNNSHFRKTKMFKFRDRIGLPHEQKKAKKESLRFFNLLAQ